MKKILISGYYGFGNIGDEAILSAMISEFKKTNNVTDITVLSNDPEQTEEDFNIDSVNRSSIVKVIKSIRSCDVLVSGGGSLLQDKTSRISIYYYLFIYFIALLFKKRIIIFSHGIGPINRKINKILIKFIFKRASSISVRDVESKEELITYGVDGNLINVTADPVISFKKFGKEDGIRALSGYDDVYDPKLPTVGFALKNDKKNCIKEDIVDVIKTIKSKQKCNIVLLPFHYKEDMYLIKDIKSLFADVIVVENKHSVNEIFSMIESFDILVGVRLHALIFAAVSETPVVGITYDPKIDAFLKSIDEKSICSADQIDKEGLVNSIEDKLTNNNVARENIRLKVFALKVKLVKYNNSIETILK